MSSTTITRYRGDTWSWLISVKINGTLQTITGDKFFFTLKKKGDYSTDDSTAILIDNATGSGTSATIAPDQEDIDAVPSGEYLYDFQWVTTAGKVTTLRSGIFIVNRDQTRRTS